MLYLFWFLVFWVAGSVLVYRAELKGSPLSIFGNCLQITAIISVFHLTITPSFIWLTSVLPNKGEVINLATAAVLMLFVVMGGIIVFNVMVADFAAKSKQKR